MSEDFNWTVHYEGQLLDAMVGHKPVGINKYFQMALILDKFTENLNKDIDPSKVWTHLGTMYNLEALDESESLPFPNDEKEFSLPEMEFGMLQSKKEDKSESEKKVSNQKGRETPKNLKEIKKDEKTPLASRTPKEKEVQRRDSKDSKDGKTGSVKKEIKKESEKSNVKVKGRSSIVEEKSTNKLNKTKAEETPKTTKRPTRGSLKPDTDSGSNGKASPLTVTPTNSKRRRIQ